ncbi:MAG: elongation factor 4 [Candidatus Spechtbacteria bacterium RIFCSPHIGHO2_01_FULL_38_11]|nr:MAG: elongation factor 4 [Candidatus Spechtbacteria bacterium RIFCSPHIGHO2_01_FULL_38_11]
METRNFVIIAHIDHGKSTLADRFLELTASVEKRRMQEQFLDQMDLERERGITIKMQPVTMNYKLPRPSDLSAKALASAEALGEGGEATNYKLNLIDTPGHVDFSYEVSRSLAAVEGAILLVDATSGIQAQTVAHLTVAAQQNLVIIPAINKVDLPQAQIKETEEEILNLFLNLGLEFEEVYKISAKTGEGVEKLLQSVIKNVPPPNNDQLSAINKPLKALIFDSMYDEYRGVIAHVRIFDGEIKKEDEILFMASKENSVVKEVGIFTPQLRQSQVLQAGDIGYVVSGIKSVDGAPIGDTITLKNNKTLKEVAGYMEPQPVVFSTIYPTSESDYDEMKDAFNKLKLNDAALYFEPEHSPVLGRGLKVGFLGMLHMEIIIERIRREYNLELVVTAPSVLYKVKLLNGEELSIFSPAQYPDPSRIKESSELWILLRIIVPPIYINNVMSLLKNKRGIYKDTEYLSAEHVRINYETPLSEIIEGFYNQLKNVTSGFGSMAYEMLDSRFAEIVKLDILLAGNEAPSLSRLVVKEKAESEGRRLVEKIKNVIPREQFAVAIQAVIGGKVVARETKPAARKDVTAKLYGGDVTRKRKLLEKQKKGKGRLEKHGRVNIDSDTMMKIFS